MINTKHTILTGALVLGIATTAGAGIALADDSIKYNGGQEKRGSRSGLIVAELLGITPEEFDARIRNGEDPHMMLASAGITPADMQKAHEARMAEHLAQQVANGTITQEEADARIEKHQVHETRRTAERTALENNDYEAWVSLVTGTPLAEKITAETFGTFARAHQLRMSGEHEEAEELFESLGIEKKKGPRTGGHKSRNSTIPPHRQ